MAESTSDLAVTQPWSQSPDEIVAALQTDAAAGLTSDEAASRRQRFGPNQLHEEKPPNLWLMFFRQFADFMVGLLAVAAVVGAVVGDWQDSLLIGAIVLGNATIGFFQERRAAQAVAALKKLAEPNARVWRDGGLKSLPAVELTLGDVIDLKGGDLVPADARLVEAAELQAAEAPLTGESFPVDKQPTAVDAKAALPDRSSMVHAGTAITGGHGLAVVTAIGMSMELGHIAKLLSGAESGPTPLEQRLTALSKKLAFVVLGVCVIVFVAGTIRHTARREEMLLVAVSLAVAAIPEGLPAVITVTLALGSQRMSRRKAIVRQLASVETLGSVDVICSDKTGTLTQNEMAVAEIVLPGDDNSQDGANNDDGEHHPSQQAIEALLRAAALSNDAQLSADGKPIGSATEVALIQAATKHGLDVAAIRRESPRVAEFPFSSARKRMSTLHGTPDGGRMVFAKGSVESILERATAIFAPGGSQPLSDEERQRLLGRSEEQAARGQRLLGVAQRQQADGAAPANAEEAERDLTFLGFVCLVDPVRGEAKQSIAECRTAGIRPVMITGDHPETARAVAEELGILTANELLLSGPDLDAASDEQLAEQVRRIGVFARVTPEHKIRIVRAHQSRGSVVAMTGDGVNDAPSLKQADIGVAMGITGTDVSKEAARMVLADDNFATIVAAVEEGRVVYDNIRKFVRFLLTTNAGEILLMLFAILLGWKVPLLPIHLLWINLVTDGLPALALGFEPAERGLMRRDPRRREESLFADGLTWKIVCMGLWMALGCLALFYYYMPDGGLAAAEADWALPRTMVFVTLSQFQLFYVLSLRSSIDPFWKLGWLSNYRLTGAVVLGTILQLAVVYVPPLAKIFHTTALAPTDLLVAMGVASSACLLSEAAKFLWHGRQTKKCD
ncbi:MAG: cation-translocating P-type ATPase [Pirellulales bacterium]